jgi:hypothetical protein
LINDAVATRCIAPDEQRQAINWEPEYLRSPTSAMLPLRA